MIERNGDLHRFLHKDVGSDESLRVLLFLARHRDRSWTVEAIRDEIGVDANDTSLAIATKRLELRLEALIEKRLVQRQNRDQSYRYAPDSAAAEDFVAQLLSDGDALADARRLIYISPRQSAAMAFANAFSGANNR